MPPRRFSAIDYTRNEGRDDRVVVLCDQERPEGVADLFGRTVDIDGALYTVLKTEDRDPSRVVRRGEPVALWITSA
jgi:hypothetical protein